MKNTEKVRILPGSRAENTRLFVWYFLCERRGRKQNQRIFPYNYLFGGGVWGGADKKWKGKFFVLVSPLQVLKDKFSTIYLLYFNILVVYNVRVGYNCGYE